MEELMKQCEFLPPKMRITDRIFWDSAAAIYGDICDFLHEFGEATTVEQLIKVANENRNESDEVTINVIAELMLEEICIQWERIKKLPSDRECIKEDWKKAGNSFDETFKQAFNVTEVDSYPRVTIEELLGKTEIPGVLELLIWKAEQYY